EFVLRRHAYPFELSIRVRSGPADASSAKGPRTMSPKALTRVSGSLGEAILPRVSVDMERRGGSDDPAPLIETKLVPPRARPSILVRTRLERFLDDSKSAALTLVDAPVGFGKTLLVQSWCANQSGAAVAWVSLDAADNDPARLWTYLPTAVDR